MKALCFDTFTDVITISITDRKIFLLLKTDICMLTSVRETLKGIVKRWIRSTGYGFIEPEEGGEDILVHHSDIGGLYELREGQKVEFEVDKTRTRSRAINVKIIG